MEAEEKEPGKAVAFFFDVTHIQTWVAWRFIKYRKPQPVLFKELCLQTENERSYYSYPHCNQRVELDSKLFFYFFKFNLKKTSLVSISWNYTALWILYDFQCLSDHLWVIMSSMNLTSQCDAGAFSRTLWSLVARTRFSSTFASTGKRILNNPTFSILRSLVCVADGILLVKASEAKSRRNFSHVGSL